VNLRDLYSVDLKSKPYAFVPHCKLEDNFFVAEYWRDILAPRGKLYYFGGIYVADLTQFRKYGYAAYLRLMY
jgi:hypothetical protein